MATITTSKSNHVVVMVLEGSQRPYCHGDMSMIRLINNV